MKLLNLILRTCPSPLKLWDKSSRLFFSSLSVFNFNFLLIAIFFIFFSITKKTEIKNEDVKVNIIPKTDEIKIETENQCDDLLIITEENQKLKQKLAALQTKEAEINYLRNQIKTFQRLLN